MSGIWTRWRLSALNRFWLRSWLDPRFLSWFQTSAVRVSSRVARVTLLQKICKECKADGSPRIPMPTPQSESTSFVGDRPSERNARLVPGFALIPLAASTAARVAGGTVGRCSRLRSERSLFHFSSPLHHAGQGGRRFRAPLHRRERVRRPQSARAARGGARRLRRAGGAHLEPRARRSRAPTVEPGTYLVVVLRGALAASIDVTGQPGREGRERTAGPSGGDRAPGRSGGERWRWILSEPVVRRPRRLQG